MRSLAFSPISGTVSSSGTRNVYCNDHIKYTTAPTTTIATIEKLATIAIVVVVQKTGITGVGLEVGTEEGQGLMEGTDVEGVEVGRKETVGTDVGLKVLVGIEEEG